MLRHLSIQSGAGSTARLRVWSRLAALLALAQIHAGAFGAGSEVAAHFRRDVQPLLTQYCYDCHGDGAKKGGVAFDELKSDDALVARHDLWWSVLKNLRAGLMPPEKKPRPSADEKRRLEEWIKREAFGLDPQDPDPGRVTLRRLNRVEYRHTIRDLMGIDFKADDEFPPDDTGYGFDNIGDVLTMSPLLLEKYMQAAETIVAAAVPMVAKVVSEISIPGGEFRGADHEVNGERLTFYKETKVAHVCQVEQAGDYRLALELEVAGQFDFDPGRCVVVFRIDGRERKREEFGWDNNKRFRFEFDERWPAGEHTLELELQPLVAADKKINSLDLRVVAVRQQGPLDERFWGRPKNFDLFFSRDVPESGAERRLYTRDVIRRFATRAFRRPVDDKTVERLASLAESQPGKTFAQAVAHAMVAVLASPRFLFRVEEAVPTATGHPFVDEYALASRLSYFLWSTMPDEELTRLAEQNVLRKNLGAQVKRMLADARSEALIENFTGQWLQARDVDGISIDARTVLARDNGEEKELKREMEEFRARFANAPAQTNRPAAGNAERPFPRRRFGKPAIELDGPLRRAMRLESERFFAHIVRENRSVTELIDSDYTFLNERLARHYGIPDVKGGDMRRVTLPKDSPRGGVLTQGGVLVVTSNPTRTSPVKRGLFILENIVGLPPPPPPANVPDLEEAEKEFKDREPTLREVLELHRNQPLCHSCHSRMDPLGLALENFNALGLWREKERSQPIDSAGKLITGEPFAGIRELKRILTHERRGDFYRCLTEKLLTYALGRGLEYYDVETVDQIIERLEREQGHFSALLLGVIESAPFQKRRNLAQVVVAKPVRPVEQPAPAKTKL